MNKTIPAISIQHLTKIFRDFWRRPRVRALNDISFDVQPGEVFGLLGPNGSGKTTALKIMLGLLRPTRGRVRMLGRSPRHVRSKERIGYLPEASHLYPYLSGEETLQFYGRLFDLDRGERRKRIEELFAMIGLRHARGRLVGEFSKGMARRIGLAQALINDPDLVVLDEPTSGLDPIGCHQVKQLIATLARRGKTVLLSSHLLANVEDVCDRVAILYNGNLQSSGPIEQLLEQPNRYRLTLPELPEETLQRILEDIQRTAGKEVVVEHPRRDLEQYFLEVIERARASGETPDRARAEPLAAYLSAAPPESTDARLRRLLQTDESPPRSERPAVESPEETEKATRGESPGTPAASPEADRRLRSLLGEDKTPDDENNA